MPQDQAPSREVLTSHANVSKLAPERFGYRVKSLLLGKPLVSEQLQHERLSDPIALGILSPDCISSSAYGPEEVLTQMTPLIGIAAFSVLVPLMYVIIGVLFIVMSSYLDVIKNYSSIGGSYVVTRANLGMRTAQVGAVALLIDYIVTVAVQCSAGTAALTSAFPNLVPYTLPITIGVVLLLMYGNLRGIREAGAYFAFPVYFYTIMLSLTIVVGFWKKFSGSLPTLKIPAHHLLVDGQFGTPGHGMLYGLGFLALLRAYANGGSSLTGLEAISDGVASFRKPEANHARRTMVVMTGILCFLLLGITYLANWTHAVPYAAGTPTVVSQEVGAVFGLTGFGHMVFYAVQFATLLILYTGGNTSFNGFPFLANYVARDNSLPRQLTKRGHRLAFSNGIIVLGVVSLSLVVIFDAKLNALVALYAIGVFTGFALAGAGMVAKHWRERTGWWKSAVAVNAVMSFITAMVVVIFLFVKFTEGAWLVAVIGPILYWGLVRVEKQYSREQKAFISDPETGERQIARLETRVTKLLVFVDTYDAATERALEFCRQLNPSSIRAVHFDIDPKVTADLQALWGQRGSPSEGITLEIAECQDRRVERAALEHVADTVRDPDVFCMVILPRRGFVSKLQRLLHDRTADAIADVVVQVPRTSATIVPYRSSRRRMKGDDIESLLSDDVERRGQRTAGETTSVAEGFDAIGDLRARRTVKISGRVRSVAVSGTGGDSNFECVVTDDTGSVTLVFQGREAVPGIERGIRLSASGMVVARQRDAVIYNPLYDILEASAGH